MLDWLRQWWPFILTGINAAIWLANMVLTRTFATKGEVQAVKVTADAAATKKAVGELGDRVGVLEGTVKAVPSRDDLFALQLEMERFRGEMGTARARIEGAGERIAAELEGVRERFAAEIQGAHRLIVRTENLLGVHNQHLLESERK